MYHVRPVIVVILIPALALFVTACGGSTGEGPSGSGNEPNQTTLVEETSPSGDPGSSGPVEVETTIVTTDLEVPWGLVFTPDGNALVTERDSGRLLSVDSSGNVEELQRLSESGSGEGGLLGLALSPNYESDGLIYVYYTTDEDNRVARFKLGEEPETILTGIPTKTYHDGGRIAFGPDGMLYVGTGDGGEPSRAQDLNSLGGKILRIEPDGSVPPDNPFSNSPVYSYGHRNVEGLAWDKQGQLYASEFGSNSYDEVNRIEPGGNYGWPQVEGTGGEPDYIDPIATFGVAEASPSGATFLKGGAIPQWKGDFFMAGLRGQRLWRLKIDENGNVTEQEALLQGQAGRLRHVVQAPDGSLWVLTSNRDGRGSPTSDDDRILRIGPASR
jgi:glucose/arabinose dehydrogenase